MGLSYRTNPNESNFARSWIYLTSIVRSRSRITRKIIRVFIWVLLRLNKLNSLGAETMNGYYFDFVRSLTLFRMGQFGFLLECCLEYNHRAHRDYSITFGAWTSLLWMLFRIFSRNRNWTKSELNSFNKPTSSRIPIVTKSSKLLVYHQETNWIWFDLLFERLKSNVEVILIWFCNGLTWHNRFSLIGILGGKNGENWFEFFLFLLRMK